MVIIISLLVKSHVPDGTPGVVFTIAREKRESKGGRGHGGRLSVRSPCIRSGKAVAEAKAVAILTCSPLACVLNERVSRNRREAGKPSGRISGEYKCLLHCVHTTVSSTQYFYAISSLSMNRFHGTRQRPRAFEGSKELRKGVGTVRRERREGVAEAGQGGHRGARAKLEGADLLSVHPAFSDHFQACGAAGRCLIPL